MSDVFRMKVAIDYNGNGTGGDWRYYENPDAMKADLLSAHLDVLANPPRQTVSSRLARLWRGDKPLYPRVSRVLAVDRHTDEGWVPVEYEIIAPDIRFGLDNTLEGSAEQ